LKIILFGMTLLATQMLTYKDKPVVHLQQLHDTIDIAFDGKLLQLVNAPAVVHLPSVPPPANPDGHPWSIDIKNLGPSAVTVEGRALLRVVVGVGQTLHVDSNGADYSLKR
jgi:hypothetical protein